MSLFWGKSISTHKETSYHGYSFISLDILLCACWWHLHSFNHPMKWPAQSYKVTIWPLCAGFLQSMLFFMSSYELDHFLCRQMWSCYFLYDWILVDIEAVFLFVVPGTLVCAFNLCSTGATRTQGYFWKGTKSTICDRNMAECHASTLLRSLLL